MTKQKVELIPIADITNKFDVRIALDEDRVIQFAGMYESDEPPPPIKVVPLAEEGKYAYIDGRHRGAAVAYLNRTEIPAVICNGSMPHDPVGLFAEALFDNYGGAKPPTRQDIVHTVVRMLEHGGNRTTIREALNFLPPGALRAYIADAESIVSKRRIAKALDAIAGGSTVEEAATKCRVKLDNLKEIVAGRKGRWGKGRSNEIEFCTAIKTYINRELRGANSGIGKKITFLIQKIEDGEVSVKQAQSVLKAWSEHLRKTSVRVKDWEARLNAIDHDNNGAVGVKE